MNYRHAFHAGNFADVHKHSVLARVLLHLRLKPAAFRVIDTHAGAGRYDLHGPEAAAAANGIEASSVFGRRGRTGRGHELLQPYLDAVAALNPDGVLRNYPGSPLIAKGLLRRAGSPDRLRARAGVRRGARRRLARRPPRQGADDRRLDGCGGLCAAHASVAGSF